MQSAAEKRWIDKIQRALNEQTNAFLIYADKNGLANALSMLDYIVTPDPMQPVVRTLYTHEGTRAGMAEQILQNRLIGSEYKDFSFFTDWLREMTSYFYSKGMRAITQITETTRDRIRRVVSEQVARQASYPEIRDAIADKEINRKRANVIARTETVSAMARGKRIAADSLPFLMRKEWIAIRDKRTRHSHRNIDGETQPLDQPYSNGGQYPGDPDLPAKEKIQCRCTEVYIPVRDANGRPVRK
jgi:uncharacterized protein with gpF-like domain